MESSNVDTYMVWLYVKTELSWGQSKSLGPFGLTTDCRAFGKAFHVTSLGVAYSVIIVMQSIPRFCHPGERGHAALRSCGDCQGVGQGMRPLPRDTVPG